MHLRMVDLQCLHWRVLRKTGSIKQITRVMEEWESMLYL